MKIVIYGISRCGKDYLIDKIIDNMGLDAIHFKGSKTLNDLANKTYNCSFNELDTKKQNELRVKLIDVVNSKEQECKNIVVDGHYSFPNSSGGFDVVFSQADKTMYDYFIYLNKSAHLIKLNSENSDRVQFKEYLKKDENIENWKIFEINHLKDICNDLNKELIIVDDDTSCAIDYICELLKDDLKFNPTYISNEIIKNILLHSTKNEVVLLDCDKTVSENDLTVDFVKKSNIDMSKIKDNFKGDHYTSYQFYRFQQILMKSQVYDEAIGYSCKNTQFCFDLIKDVGNNKRHVSIFGLTTGISDAWFRINDSLKLFSGLFGKYQKIKCENDYFITPTIKGLVCKGLVNAGKIVTAVGDSIIDLQMLKYANFGFLIAHNKLDDRLKDGLLKESNIKQLKYSKCKYEELEEVESIWLKH